MAERTIRKFSSPSNTNVPIGPTTTAGDGNFELKPALINMVQANPFFDKPNEDANAHLQHFLEVCRTFTIRGVTDDAIRLSLFPFSLLKKANQWFYAKRDAINTWDKYSKAFLAKFFPVGKTNALRARIRVSSSRMMRVPRKHGNAFRSITACLHHGMHRWFLIQTFYHRLKRTSREHLDAAAGGAFFSLQVPTAKELIEKMVENQGWDGDRLQPLTRGVHQVDGIDMIAAKMDLLMKKLEASTNMETAKIMDAHMMCEVCGNVGHSSNDCLETREEASFINNGNNNGFRNHNFNNQWWNSRPNFPFNNQNGGNYSNSFNNQPSITDLVFSQARINESLTKKLAANEKVLENLNSTIESFTSAMKNQLSFNKMIETQLAQLATSLPYSESAGIPGQPEPTREHVSTISTRWGKPSRGMYAPNHVGKPIHQIQDP
jgi:uncharacterized coiled-coil protein SlyX